jgi:hypothetical protein
MNFTKQILLLGTVLVGVFSAVPQHVEAQSSRVCPRIVDVTSRAAGALLQYKNAQVQRRGGVGTALSGFLQNPTIISTQGRNPFSLSRAIIYNRQGRALCTSDLRQGCASSRGECLARYKFGCSTRAIRQAAPGGALIKVSPQLCVRVPNPGRCYNVKVRDLCDGRTL